MATQTLERIACPSRQELRALLKGGLPADRADLITGHLDECAACQNTIEFIAADGADHISSTVRHIDTADPPKNSAYWKALDAAELELTRSLSVDRPSPSAGSGELKLDFLTPSSEPGFLGKLSHFEVLRLLGRGGMGAVFQATDPNLNRDVAIKVLDPTLAHNDTARARFVREARSAASVTHENLVAVYSVAEEEKTKLPYFVMQLVAGETLEQRLRRQGKLSVPEAVRVGMQAAAGLAAAHGIGLIHRDIKPGNILIEAGTDKVKLTDFGLARGIEDLKLTRTGFVAGTPLYMAPEQARGEDVDHRADLFSLGSVLYESLAGRPPFEGKTPLAVLRRIADDRHESLQDLSPEVPDWLEDLIDQLLSKDPARRYQSAAEVADVLAVKHQCLSPASKEAAAALAAGPCAGTLVKSKLIRRRPKLAAALLSGVPFLAGLAAGGAFAWAAKPDTYVQVPVEAVTNIPPASVAAAAPTGPVGPAEMRLLRGGTGAVWNVASTQDGKTVAMGLEDGHIMLWDVATGRRLFDLAGHAGPVWSVDFTNDGKNLVSASDDGSVKIWDLAKEKVIKSLPHPGSVRSAAINKEMNWVVTGDRAGTVRVWDLNEQMPIREYNHGGAVSAVAFSPDGLTVASAGTDKRVVLWEVPGNIEGRKRIELSGPAGHAGPVYSVSFSPDGQWLASGGWDGNVIVWELNQGQVVKKFPAHEDGVWSVDFACCGKMLATGGQDGVVKVWEAETGTEKARFSRHKGVVHVVRFGPRSGDGFQ